MMDIVKRFFGKKDIDATTDRSTTAEPVHDVRVAVCALCIEIARIDNRFTDQELKTLMSILQDKYDLSESYRSTLIKNNR